MKKIMYIRDSQWRPIGCMASFIAREDNMIAVGISSFSEEDKFSKKLGRDIAWGRMMGNPIYMDLPITVSTSNDVVGVIFNYILKNEDNLPQKISSKVLRSMRRWLVSHNMLKK